MSPARYPDLPDRHPLSQLIHGLSSLSTLRPDEITFTGHGRFMIIFENNKSSERADRFKEMVKCAIYKADLMTMTKSAMHDKTIMCYYLRDLPTPSYSSRIDSIRLGPTEPLIVTLPRNNCDVIAEIVRASESKVSQDEPFGISLQPSL